MVSHTEKESIPGQMVKSTKESGLQDSKKDKASGKVYSVILTLESGDSLKQLAMEFISGKMEISTKENGGTVLSMAKVQIYLPMVTYFLERTSVESRKVKVNTSGRMAAFILENFRTDSSTARENGESVSMPKTAICMKETTNMTKKMEWANSLGKVAISTKDATKMMRDTDTEKCIGRTDLATRENGRKEFNTVLDEWYFQTEE